MSILQKNKKAAAGIGVVAAAAAVLALGAGTYAAFTDTEQTQATFASGTLDLRIGATGEAANLKFQGIYPGWSEERTITVANAGTVNGLLTLSATLTGDENGCKEPEREDATVPCSDGAGNLAESIEVSVNGGSPVPLTSLAELANSVVNEEIAAGREISVKLTFLVDQEDVGNEIQSDTLDVILNATLEQADQAKD